MKYTLLFLLLTFLSLSASAQGKKAAEINGSDTVITNLSGKGLQINLDFSTGSKYSHPVIAIWIEDMDENYIQTLYVSYSIATGIFEHGQEKDGKWAPGERRRPSALPYWSYKRHVMASDGLFVPDRHTPVPDAYTGATPQKNFVLKTKSDNALNGKFRILLEINQAFDWNDYWHNSKYPDDENYKTSSQPSVVYSVTIDPDDIETEYYMNPVGHGHYSGKDGKLYTDLSTLTTALKLVKSIKVKLVK